MLFSFIIIEHNILDCSAHIFFYMINKCGPCIFFLLFRININMQTNSITVTHIHNLSLASSFIFRLAFTFDAIDWFWFENYRKTWHIRMIQICRLDRKFTNIFGNMLNFVTIVVIHLSPLKINMFPLLHIKSHYFLK